MPVMVMDTLTTTDPTELRSLHERDLLRLMAWLSPSFPVGAFSYSHGLEYAVEAGRVTDKDMLLHWASAILSQGSGRVDAALFRATHEAVLARDEALLFLAL
jgi:urease accessory protein